MRHVSLAEMPCPVARTLDVIGEWWSLLIVRDAFLGARRFDDFKASGIADNILAARLKRLVEQGIFERRRYQERPERFEYLLTEKGRDLLLVVGALATWGLKWSPGSNLNRMRHLECGHAVTVRGYCDECGRAVTADELNVVRLKPEEAVATA
jgi:DNA-binding HxlR family transcriptional regulator